VGVGTGLSPTPSVDQSVGLSRGYSVEKQLIGSGCCLGGECGWSRDGCIRWGWRFSRSRGSFGDNIVTSGTLWHSYSLPWEMATWLFPN